MAVPGCNNVLAGGEVLLLLGPEHANTIARDGFSKEEVKKILFEEARVPLNDFPESALDWIYTMRPHLKDIFEKKAGLPIADRWQDIQVAIAGGAGKHSAFIPTFGTTKSITKCIALRDGQPARSIKEFRRAGVS